MYSVTAVKEEDVGLANDRGPTRAEKLVIPAGCEEPVCEDLPLSGGDGTGRLIRSTEINKRM